MVELYTMSLLRKKTWWQILLNSRLTIAALLLAIFALSLAVYDRYVVEREMMSRRVEAEAEVSKLNERKATLEKRVEYLQNDQGLETEIRRHFDVAKEGEQVVVLLGEKPEEAVVAATTSTPEEEKSWWNIFSW